MWAQEDQYQRPCVRLGKEEHMTNQEVQEMLEEQMNLLSDRMKKETDSRVFCDLAANMRDNIYAWVRLCGDKDRLL